MCSVFFVCLEQPVPATMYISTRTLTRNMCTSPSIECAHKVGLMRQTSSKSALLWMAAPFAWWVRHVRFAGGCEVDWCRTFEHVAHSRVRVPKTNRLRNWFRHRRICGRVNCEPLPVRARADEFGEALMVCVCVCVFNPFRWRQHVWHFRVWQSVINHKCNVSHSKCE